MEGMKASLQKGLDLRSMMQSQTGEALRVQALVDEQLIRISDQMILSRIRELLVPPYPIDRPWDYGLPGESHTCWTVLEHAPSNTGIAYCAQGFGPSFPWGLVFLAGPYMNIGMDAGWFASLEEAMRDCKAWDEPNPPASEAR